MECYCMNGQERPLPYARWMQGKKCSHQVLDKKSSSGRMIPGYLKEVPSLEQPIFPENKGAQRICGD